MRAIKITGTFDKMGGKITDPVATIKRVQVQHLAQNPGGVKPCFIVELNYSETATGEPIQVDAKRLPAGMAIAEIWKSDQKIQGTTWSDVIYNAVADFIRTVSKCPATVIEIDDSTE